MSAEIGFSRRWWGNFTVTDNRAIGPQDFDIYTFTAPSDPRLPSSGQPVSYYLRNNQTAFGAVDNYLTLADNYGGIKAYWQGLELNVNARATNSITLQGGFTTGAGTRDLCALGAAVPELYSTVGILLSAATSPIEQVSACRVEEPWLWNWRGLATYIVPKIDVQVSAIMRSQANVQATNDPASNGLAMNATFFQTNAAIQAALGRPIAGGASTVALDLAKPGASLSGPAQHGGYALHEDHQDRSHAHQRGRRFVQPAQRQHRHLVQPELRDRRLHLAASERHPEPALRALQRHRGLLISDVRSHLVALAPGFTKPSGREGRESSWTNRPGIAPQVRSARRLRVA